MQTAGHSHNIAGSVGTALLAGGFVFCGIPGVSDAAAFRVEVQRVVNAFPGGNHTEFPVFHNNRYPVAGEIDGSVLLRSTTAARRAATTSCGSSALSLEGEWSDQ